MLAANRGKSLDTFLSKFPVKEFDTDDDYYWDVIGSSRKNVPLVECRDENGVVVDTTYSGNVGAGFSMFTLVFPYDWFAEEEVIWGNLNEVYPIQVKSACRFEGTNAVYTVQVYGTNSKGIPAERLLAGERFSVGYAPVERSFSRRVGDVRHATPMSMRNEWSQIRISNKVGGSMLNKKVAFGIPVTKKLANGKLEKTTSDMWMHNEEWETEIQFNEYKNNVEAWGVSTRNSNGEYYNFGKSGEVLRQGDGLFKQMEYGNSLPYTKFSLKLLEDALYQLSSSKLAMNDRNFVLCTGEYGAIQFNKAVKHTVAGWTSFTLDNASIGVIQKANSELHKNSLSAGYQFTEFYAPNGVHVSLCVDPMYDDPVRNKVMHPNGGVAMSYRYDIFYIGSSEQPNIQKCAIKGQHDYRGYEWGLRNPYTGQMGNPNMSFDEDAAIFHRMATTGVVVYDPTRTMSLIPAVLMG